MLEENHLTLDHVRRVLENLKGDIYYPVPEFTLIKINYFDTSYPVFSLNNVICHSCIRSIVYSKTGLAYHAAIISGSLNDPTVTNLNQNSPDYFNNNDYFVSSYGISDDTIKRILERIPKHSSILGISVSNMIDIACGDSEDDIEDQISNMVGPNSTYVNACMKMKTESSHIRTDIAPKENEARMLKSLHAGDKVYLYYTNTQSLFIQKVYSIKNDVNDTTVIVTDNNVPFCANGKDTHASYYGVDTTPLCILFSDKKSAADYFTEHKRRADIASNNFAHQLEKLNTLRYGANESTLY